MKLKLLDFFASLKEKYKNLQRQAAWRGLLKTKKERVEVYMRLMKGLLPKKTEAKTYE